MDRDSTLKTSDRSGGHRPLRIPFGIALVAFLGIAGFFLWSEHKAHILGALPWLLLLACLFLHCFMHSGHGSHHSDDGHGASPARHGSDRARR
jgi:nitrate/nitrite transporter NarK